MGKKNQDQKEDKSSIEEILDVDLLQSALDSRLGRTTV